MGGKESVKAGAEPPPRRKRERREDVRARILEAAFRVFAERGYEGSSLERVAEAAGFSKGAVYSNFAGKDELFFELMSAKIDERIEAVRLALSRRGGSRAEPVAKAAGRALREFGQEDPAWQLLFLEFWLRCARREDLRAAFAERRREMRRRIAELIVAQAEAAGAVVARSDAMDLATVVLALSNGLGIEGLVDPKAAPPRLLGEVLSRVVEGTLARPSGPDISRSRRG